ncbi:hypothetical protein ACIBF7_22125 [Nonomuraea sp. NPDC050478]|uniref:hypothetical protein n=1 Tax=unclassified Nonomuraea TaxID=2593643 RepID=UPI0011CD8484|nr:hypothetical protein [Nonomuraea sp. C10]TXK42463.1 hypothetical protein FR742_25420 [Nonomuraea sp. C10]
MASGIRHIAERVTLTLTVGLGAVVSAAALFGWFDPGMLGAAIPKITLLILSTVTLFLLLELDRLRAIEKIKDLIVTLDVEAIARDRKVSHYGGVIRIHRRFAEDVFIDHLVTARREAAILQTWIPHLHRLEDALEEALHRGVRVRVLLLHPRSAVAKLREEALRVVRDPALEEDVPANVERCLSVLASVHKKAGANKHLLGVRIYDSLPSIAVYRADDRYFVSSFLHGKLAVDSTQLEIDGADTPMGAEIQGELDMLWAVGHDVDLSDWRTSLKDIPPRRPT